MKVNTAQLVGQTEDHLVTLEPGDMKMHKDVLHPFRELQSQARSAGFELTVASSFRSFDRQLTIWNEKAAGLRPVLDAQGVPLAIESLSETQLMWAILNWSALPGASRHHWGTDMDIWDKAAVASDYRLKLEVEEYQQGGPFFPMVSWLRQQLVNEHVGFVFPYCADQGGVQPEPWHLSYQPVAAMYACQYSIDTLEKVIGEADILLKNSILDNIEEIFRRFVLVSPN